MVYIYIYKEREREREKTKEDVRLSGPQELTPSLNMPFGCRYDADAIESKGCRYDASLNVSLSLKVVATSLNVPLSLKVVATTRTKRHHK